VALSDEEKAFLIKIGQGLPKEIKETQPKETTTQKVEE
jgi:hypothetical protein